MKKIIFFLVTLIFHFSTMAQLNQTQIDLAAAEMKYWKLRGRLIGDENNLNKFSGFTSVGNAKGQSLPFNRRPMSDNL